MAASPFDKFTRVVVLEPGSGMAYTAWARNQRALDFL